MPLEQTLYPLVPFAVPKPWGGGHLDLLARRSGTEKIGEYVLFSDLAQFPVKVKEGTAEVSLADFWTRYFSDRGPVPFMLKILSTAEPISVQNHPSDQDVRELGLAGNGKLEAWTILEAAADARMYLGLKKEHPPEILRQLETLANPLSVFHEMAPQPGEVVTLFPGLVHSTTGRMLFYEIQQMSDHTFRIYDFGRGRALHVDHAIHCVKRQDPEVSDFNSDLMTERFSVSYHRPKSGLIALRSERAAVITWFGHNAQLSCGTESYRVQWGDSFIIPNAAGRAISVAPEAEAVAGLPVVDMLFEAHL